MRDLIKDKPKIISPLLFSIRFEMPTLKSTTAPSGTLTTRGTTTEGRFVRMARAAIEEAETLTTEPEFQ
jgi:hypothetical protein